MNIGDTIYIPNTRFNIVHEVTISDIDAAGCLIVNYEFFHFNVTLDRDVKVYLSKEDANKELFKRLLRGRND